MNTFEVVAAGTYLCYWPDDTDFQTLIKRLKAEDFGDDDEAIEPVDYFAGYPGEFIADCIMDLQESLQWHFKVNHDSH